MQEIILLGRQKRNQEKIKVKTPLSNLTIIHAEQSVLDQIKKLESYIKIELNVKNIEYSDSEDEFIVLFAKPNSPILGKRLGKSFGQFRPKIQALSNDVLKKVEQGEPVTIDGEVFTSDEILVYREAKEGINAISNRFITINLDCNLSDDLISEGLAREVVNRIQKTRKELNFNVDDRINVNYSGSQKIKDALITHSQYVASETLSKQICYHDDLITVYNFDIDGEQLTIELEVVS
jgi:isoleucyl-tRNA synthetase